MSPQYTFLWIQSLGFLGTLLGPGYTCSNIIQLYGTQCRSHSQRTRRYTVVQIELICKPGGLGVYTILSMQSAILQGRSSVYVLLDTQYYVQTLLTRKWYPPSHPLNPIKRQDRFKNSKFIKYFVCVSLRIVAWNWTWERICSYSLAIETVIVFTHTYFLYSKYCIR